MAEPNPPRDPLEALTPERLAAEGEYVALAALAARAADPDALQALAAASAEPSAFVWMWAVLADDPSRWPMAVSHLPDHIGLPTELEEAVTTLVLEGLNEPEESPTSAAAAAVLSRIADRELRLLVARSVAGVEESVGPVRDLALDLLASSPDPADVADAWRQIASLPASDQPAQLVRFCQEANRPRLTRAVGDALRRPGPLATEQRIALVDILCWLGPTGMGQVLSGNVDPEVMSAVLGRRLVAQLLEAEGLRDLLDMDLSGPTRDQLLRAAAGALDPEGRWELTLWAHGRFNGDGVRVLRQRLLDDLTAADPSTRGTVLSYLWRLTVASGDEQPYRELASVLQPVDLNVAVLPAVDGEATAWRLGVVTGLALSGDPPSFTSAAGRVADSIGTEAVRAQFLVGVTEALRNIDELPGELATRLFRSPSAIEALSLAGQTEQLVAMALSGAEPDPALLVHAGTSHLDDDAVARLVAAVGFDARDTDGSRVYPLMVEALDARPTMLIARLAPALASLGGDAPIEPQLLALHLSRALDAGLASPGADDAAAVRLLLHSEYRPLVALACRWIEEMDPADAVDLVIEVDQATGHESLELAALRRRIAGRLSAIADDDTVDVASRLRSLDLAGQAAPDVARQIAFALLRRDEKALRRSAAELLSHSAGPPGEAMKLKVLIGAERDAPTKELLQRALRQARAGDR